MTVRIPLRGKHGKGLFALVDDEDESFVVEAGPWYGFPKEWGTYARTGGKTRFMHNLVMGVIGIDHINHNTLDNRRCNLRVATPSQNGANTRKTRRWLGAPTSSKFKGVVAWTNQSGRLRWRARLGLNGKSLSLGCFDTEDEAALAYNAAAREHFGQFALLNQVEEQLSLWAFREDMAA